jgi:hypothetical protein
MPARIIHDCFCCDRQSLTQARRAGRVGLARKARQADSKFEVPETSDFGPQTLPRLAGPAFPARFPSRTSRESRSSRLSRATPLFRDEPL